MSSRFFLSAVLVLILAFSCALSACGGEDGSAQAPDEDEIAQAFEDGFANAELKPREDVEVLDEESDPVDVKTTDSGTGTGTDTDSDTDIDSDSE